MAASPRTPAPGVIPLVAAAITEIDTHYLERRISEGLLTGHGETASFEREFASRFGRSGAVAVNSGSSALQIALLALGVGPGDDVVIPSYTCVAVLHAVEACGARAIVVDNEHDVEHAQYHVANATFRRAVTPATRAIVVSHMFGTVGDVPLELGIPVVEDFTLSLGAVDGDRRAGSLGTIAVTSLHESKMISCGRGGMLLADDASLIAKARSLVDYEAEMPRWRGRPRSALRGSFAPAFSFGMSELQAALGNSQLSQLDDFLERRQRAAARYTGAFGAAGIECPAVPTDLSNVFFRYMISIAASVPDVLDALRSVGVEAGRGVFPPIHVLSGAPDETFPGAVWCTDHLLSIPVHPSLVDDEVELVIAEVLRVLG